MKKNLFTLAMMALLACSCSSGSQDQFNLNDYMDTENYTDENEIRIPFTTRGGVKHIRCLLNGLINIDMIFDSGCSGATISIEEATLFSFERSVDYEGL